MILIILLFINVNELVRMKLMNRYCILLFIIVMRFITVFIITGCTFLAVILVMDPMCFSRRDLV